MQNVRVGVSKELPIILRDVATEERTLIAANDLNRLDEISVFVSPSIEFILEGIQFIAHTQLSKTIGIFGDDMIDL